MAREVLGRASPLFGRRTAQIHLQPFGYLDAPRFHPRWSPTDRARAYFLVGGLPQYLLSLDDARSIDVNIRRHLLDEFAPLFHEPTFLLREELRKNRALPCHSLRRRVRPWQRACYRGRHRTAGSKPALLPPAARESRLPAAAVSAGAPAPESEADALRHRRSAASLLVSIRVSQHERHTQRGCRARVQRAGCAVARCVVRNLFRTPVPRGPSTHLRERGGRHRIRDRGVLESGCADRCRRHARRQLDGSRRVQVEDRAVAPGAGSGAGPKGRSVPQHPGRDAWPPLLRAPQARGQGGGERVGTRSRTCMPWMVRTCMPWMVSTHVPRRTEHARSASIGSSSGRGGSRGPSCAAANSDQRALSSRKAAVRLRSRLHTVPAHTLSAVPVPSLNKRLLFSACSRRSSITVLSTST